MVTRHSCWFFHSWCFVGLLLVAASCWWWTKPLPGSSSRGILQVTVAMFKFRRGYIWGHGNVQTSARRFLKKFKLKICQFLLNPSPDPKKNTSFSATCSARSLDTHKMWQNPCPAPWNERNHLAMLPPNLWFQIWLTLCQTSWKKIDDACWASWHHHD